MSLSTRIIATKLGSLAQCGVATQRWCFLSYLGVTGLNNITILPTPSREKR